MFFRGPETPSNSLRSSSISEPDCESAVYDLHSTVGCVWEEVVAAVVADDSEWDRWRSIVLFVCVCVCDEG